MGRRYSQSPCSRHNRIVLGEEISIGGLDYMFGSAHSPTCTNWIYKLIPTNQDLVNQQPYDLFVPHDVCSVVEDLTES